MVQFHSQTLENFYATHQYPVAQGPAHPPLDRAQHVLQEKTDHEVFADRTVFHHENKLQVCYEWKPVKAGIDAFGGDLNISENKSSAGISGYDLKKVTNLKIEGAASLVDMSIVYTCNLQNCVIHCSCKVCTDTSSACRNICQEFPCENCSSQCTEHKFVGLHRLFEHSKDHFTIITDKLNFFRYAIPYPGISLGCEVCTKDVLEHQVLHHVFHLRCKFCRLESRPYDLMNGPGLKDYKEAATFKKNKDARTCSYCWKVLRDSYEMKKHERSLHEGADSKHKCEKCEKSFMNSNALKYHAEKHNEPPKFNCKTCGKQYLSIKGLTAHEEIVHGSISPPEFTCDECDKLFTTRSHLNRHVKSAHSDVKVNIEIVDSVDKALDVKCQQCDKQFRRKDVLKRHVKTVHSDLMQFSCPVCSQNFSRKDVLTRHVKLQHS